MPTNRELTPAEQLHKRACMRALYPYKRSLDFGPGSLVRVVSYYKSHFPHTTDAMLFAMVIPTEGDIAWAGLVRSSPRSPRHPAP